MTEPQKTQNKISYAEERLFVLVVASTILGLYGIVYCGLIFYYSVFTSSIPLGYIYVAEGVSWAVILGLHFVGGREKPFVIAGSTLYTPNLNSNFSFGILLVALVFFIAQVWLPIYLLGGSINSVFSSTLIAMCGLVVVVSNSWGVRISFGLVCLILYWHSAYWYFPIISVERPGFFTGLHVASTVFSTSIALFLSWKGTFSIFPNE